MRKRLLTLAATVALAAVAAAPAAVGAAVVEIRVDSAVGPTTLFAGNVETQPHPVDGGDGSGAHSCTGPAGAPAGATATGALDDAMRAADIPWRGIWNPSFRDFFIDSVGPFASTAPDSYWSLTVNGRFSGGGCLTQVHDGDVVHFAYGPLFGEGATPGESESPPRGASPTGPRSGGNDTGGGVTRPPARARALGLGAVHFLRHHRAGPGAEWARLALALRAGKGLGSAAAGLLGDRLAERRRDGSIGGDVNATALAVLALEQAKPAAAARSAAWLVAVQGPSGGFGYRPGAGADVDTTGLATWALARTGSRAAARRAAAFVRATQWADGGFPSLTGGEPNAQSTGFALLALRAAGLGVRRAAAPGGPTGLDYLRSLARPDGSIAYTASAAPTPVWTTAQALLGLTGRARLLAPSGQLTGS